MPDSDVVVLVVAYGAPDLLSETLDALGSRDVLVVDNSSDPAVRAAARGVRYVDAGRNLGFAGGVNLGLRELGEDRRDVLLLNPDARVRRDQLEQLHAVLAGDARLAAVSPALVDSRGAPQRVLWPFPSPVTQWREALGFPSPAADWLVGACLLLRRQALEDVGGFDERYFLYQEETDWQRRAVTAGWRVAVVDEVVVPHVGAGTSSDPDRRLGQFHAAVETYVRRWYGPLGWLGYRAAAVGGAALRGLVLHGGARTAARARAALYLRGPRKDALARGFIPY